MLELWAEPPNGAVLLDADLRPAEEFVHKGLEAEPAIRTLSGRIRPHFRRYAASDEYFRPVAG